MKVSSWLSPDCHPPIAWWVFNYHRSKKQAFTSSFLWQWALQASLCLLVILFSWPAPLTFSLNSKQCAFAWSIAQVWVLHCPYWGCSYTTCESVALGVILLLRDPVPPFRDHSSQSFWISNPSSQDCLYAHLQHPGNISILEICPFSCLCPPLGHNIKDKVLMFKCLKCSNEK